MMPAVEAKRTVAGRGRHRRAWPNADISSSSKPSFPVLPQVRTTRAWAAILSWNSLAQDGQ